MSENNNKKIINLIGPLKLYSPIIDKSIFSIIIDGGQNHNINFPSSLSLGDQDSSNNVVDILLPRDKDYSDYSKALDYIDSQTSIINCYGLFGGRLDHQLAIIGETCDLLSRQKSKFNFYHDKKIKMCILSPGNWKFSQKNEFSLHSLAAQKIKITGNIKYTLSEYTYIKPLSSHTISNIAYGQFEILCERPLVIYFNH